MRKLLLAILFTMFVMSSANAQELSDVDKAEYQIQLGVYYANSDVAKELENWTPGCSRPEVTYYPGWASMGSETKEAMINSYVTQMRNAKLMCYLATL